MADDIKHIGVVKDSSEKTIFVTVQPESACAACHAKGVCSVSDTSTERVVKAKIENGDLFSKGEKVHVSISRTTGYRALYIGYLFPLIIVVGVLFALSFITNSEAIIGLGSIFSLAIYYVLVWLLKDKIDKKFSFRVKKV